MEKWPVHNVETAKKVNRILGVIKDDGIATVLLKII